MSTPSDSRNSLGYPGIPSVGNRLALKDSQNANMALPFTAPITTTAYVSFLLKVTDASNLRDNGFKTPPGYFMNFAKELNVSTGLVARVSLRKGSESNTFNLGILNTTGGTAGPEDLYGNAPANYKVGTTYFIVVKHDLTGDNSKTSPWVNPAMSGTEPAAVHSSSFGASDKQTNLSYLMVRQAVQSGSEEIDEIRVGTSWADVVSGTLGTAENSKKSERLIANTAVQNTLKLLTTKTSTVRIYNAAGILVKNVSAGPGAEIDTASLPVGAYFIQVVMDGTVYPAKIIKY